MELNDTLLNLYSTTASLQALGKCNYYRRPFHSVLSGNPPTLTHEDLQRKMAVSESLTGDLRVVSKSMLEQFLPVAISLTTGTNGLILIYMCIGMSGFDSRC